MQYNFLISIHLRIIVVQKVFQIYSQMIFFVITSLSPLSVPRSIPRSRHQDPILPLVTQLHHKFGTIHNHAN